MVNKTSDASVLKIKVVVPNSLHSLIPHVHIEKTNKTSVIEECS